MTRIVVAGVVNVEVSLRVPGFPVEYSPFNAGPIEASPSGVGFNIAAALATLGTEARFAGFVGRDPVGVIAKDALRSGGMWGRGVVTSDVRTPRSVVLYDSTGRRSVHTDLGKIPSAVYPPRRFTNLLEGADCAVLCNIGFTRALLVPTREREVMIACDVHAIADVHDAYNADYMAHADVLFMSGERVDGDPGEWLGLVLDTYRQCRVAVVGLGARGCCIRVRGESARFVAAADVRPVINTVGAGDALFASFLHDFVGGMDPHEAIERAVVFAGWKVGESGGSRGFPTPALMANLMRERSGNDPPHPEPIR